MFAPIIIPTLNRYEHLIRCIESLKKNTLAKDTDIYISLDYPPNEKYVQGHSKIKYYLEKELTEGFKEIHIYIQEKNLGATGNSRFLRMEAYKKFEAYIYTEDDNEFSPNFLEYVNKGLELYNDDNQILAVCGYRKGKANWNGGGNVRRVQNFNAWGFATWKSKIDECNNWICRKNFYKLLKNRDFCELLYNESYELFYAFVEFFLANPKDYKSVYINSQGDFSTIDYAKAIYILATGKYVIMPKVSMVRNWGFDGSGANCARLKAYNPEDVSIDKNMTFDYCCDTQDIESNACEELYKDSSYKKLAKRAKIYRFIICIMGAAVARKINNASYLINRLWANVINGHDK